MKLTWPITENVREFSMSICYANGNADGLSRIMDAASGAASSPREKGEEV